MFFCVMEGEGDGEGDGNGEGDGDGKGMEIVSPRADLENINS